MNKICYRDFVHLKESLTAILRSLEKFHTVSNCTTLKKEDNMAVKYVFVTGGVVSGLGKGITAASLGR